MNGSIPFHLLSIFFQLSSNYLPAISPFLYCPLRIQALVIHTSCRNAFERRSNHPNRKVFIAKEKSTRGSRYRPKANLRSLYPGVLASQGSSVWFRRRSSCISIVIIHSLRLLRQLIATSACTWAYPAVYGLLGRAGRQGRLIDICWDTVFTG